MASHHHQTPKLTEGVVLPLVNTGERGSVCKEDRSFLRHVCPDDTVILGWRVGSDPPHGADPGRVLPLGGEAYRGKTPISVAGWEMGIPYDSVGPVGGGD